MKKSIRKTLKKLNGKTVPCNVYTNDPEMELLTDMGKAEFSEDSVKIYDLYTASGRKGTDFTTVKGEDIITIYNGIGKMQIDIKIV
jgi:hypothetical protein